MARKGLHSLFNYCHSLYTVCRYRYIRRIYGEFYHPQDGEGKMPVAIIAHGFNGSYHYGKNYFKTFGELE